METKICGKCGRELPLTSFVKHKQCNNGRAGTCRECANTYTTEWKRKNSKRLAEQRRALYATRYGPIQREKEKVRKAQFPLRVRAQYLRAGMRSRSIARGMEFASDLFSVAFLMEWLRRSPFCECCGVALDIGFKDTGHPNNKSPSMDRIRADRGYIEGNVALLCWRCNNLKRDATADELRVVADWLDSLDWGNEYAP